MTLNQLASEIAKRERKKSQVKIGDIREILKIMVDMEAESKFGPADVIFRAAIHQLSKRQPKKRGK